MAAISDFPTPNEPSVPEGHAFGHSGIAPTWTSSAKDVVGCSLGPSRVWFTMGFGIVNEVYYPRVDIPQLRDLGFIVADGRGFWAEVKRLENYSVGLLARGTPAVKIALTAQEPPCPVLATAVQPEAVDGSGCAWPDPPTAPHFEQALEGAPTASPG